MLSEREEYGDFKTFYKFKLCFLVKIFLLCTLKPGAVARKGEIVRKLGTDWFKTRLEWVRL